jgi:hypothetical protein
MLKQAVFYIGKHILLPMAVILGLNPIEIQKKV